MLSDTFRFHYGNIVEISVQLVVIEAETNNEMVWNFEATVFDWDLYYAP